MRFVVAAAGTGGHVLPGLAIADALRRRGADPGEIHFLGGDRFEATAVPAAGYPFHGFRLARLVRSATPSNLAIPFITGSTSRAMAQTMRDLAADVVIGMSGYVTVPASLASRQAGVRLVVHEQNSAPTLAARFGARLAERTLLGLPGPAERLPRSEVVGNPLRSELRSFDREALRDQARRRYGLSVEGPVLGIIGGSLGARVLNESVAAIVATTGSRVVHLTGPAEAGLTAGEGEGRWVRRTYEPQMDQFYAAVDLVVCRAGAMTVSELAATATPSILVPLERVGQLDNARVLHEAGAGVIIRQSDIATLPGQAAALLGAPDRLADMSARARRAARPDAAEVVADRLMEIAGG